jgi:lipid-A-disaccharide synthase
VGATEALTRVPRFLYDYWCIRQKLLLTRPDLTLFIDAPAVHMRLAPVMQRHGLRCAYYFPPSGWSRQAARLRDIHSKCEALIPAFAFSAEQYALHGLPVAYFGHPLVDLCATLPRCESLQQLGLPEGHYAALMPGSRTQEIRLLLPPFLETARRLNQEFPDLVWLLPAANPQIGQRIRQILPDPPPWLRILQGQSRAVMGVARVGLLASGSATLEACLLNMPHLICYKFNPLDYLIGYWLRRLQIVRVEFFGLPNLVLQEGVIPELLQQEVNPAGLVQQLRPLLGDSPERQQALAQLARVREKLGPPGAVLRVTEFVERMALGQSRDEALA